VSRARPPWEFPYAPVAAPRRAASGPVDVVVATKGHVAPARIAGALRALGVVEVRTLLDRAPLHWTRVRATAHASPQDVAGALAGAGVTVRYVASARHESMLLAPPVDARDAPRVDPGDWRPRTARSWSGEAAKEGTRWYLGAHGVHVDRAVCGSGAGVRLAVIDDDAAEAEHLDLDRTVSVEVDALSAASGHGALMVAWSVGARRERGGFAPGVAPDASPRLYLVPKAGDDVVALALAIARAVLDGADVVMCATYVSGTSSPMLDDALQVAAELGRGGLGALVVMPTGRESSSPGDSLHASLSLALGDPAADPRVHCAAPCGTDGGWFLWRDARGRLRPFANRGPSVRWLAPGDDLDYPFSTRERTCHAESSGAAAVTAGVMALVLATNPTLTAPEVHALLERTAAAPAPQRASDRELADPFDVLPAGRDPDRHDAKHGYGRLDAARACAGGGDPVALALAAVGASPAAEAWAARAARPYSAALGRWAVRVLLGRADVDHAARSLARHARLVAAARARSACHAQGAVERQLGVVVRELMRGAPPALHAELGELLRRLDAGVRRAEPDPVLTSAAALLFEDLSREPA